MNIILTSAQPPHGKCGHVHCAVCAVACVAGVERGRGRGNLGTRESVSLLRLASDNIITYKFKQIANPGFKDVIREHKTQMYHILNDTIVKF